MDRKFHHMDMKIFKKGDGSYAIHEVIYNRNGEIIQVPNKPVSMVGNDPYSIIHLLKKALSDIDGTSVMTYEDTVKGIQK